MVRHGSAAAKKAGENELLYSNSECQAYSVYKSGLFKITLSTHHQKPHSLVYTAK